MRNRGDAYTSGAKCSDILIYIFIFFNALNKSLLHII